VAQQRSTAHAVFGAQVRIRRERRGLSQSALADASGLHRSYVGGIERGERNPSLTNIARIADALDISIAQLFATSGDGIDR
jgi:transcriptional regulator with XRE-family HTH domain